MAGALHHGETSREGDDDTGQPVGINSLAGSRADGTAYDLLQSIEHPCTRTRTSSLELPASSAVRVVRHAEAVFTESWRTYVRGKYNCEPSVTYFESPVTVDNVTHEIVSDG